MPKISYIGNQAPVICTACPLRWRSAASDPDSASLELSGFDAGFITSRARNPAPQFASSESESSAVA